MPSKTDRLLAELSDQPGLSEVDAYRSAFVALALEKGWTKARIGRYLGISRARVGQKYEKLEHYISTSKMPTLRRVMNGGIAAEAKTPASDLVVSFKATDWQDIEFARAVIDSLNS